MQAPIVVLLPAALQKGYIQNRLTKYYPRLMIMFFVSLSICGLIFRVFVSQMRCVLRRKKDFVRFVLCFFVISNLRYIAHIQRDRRCILTAVNGFLKFYGFESLQNDGSCIIFVSVFERTNR